MPHDGDMSKLRIGRFVDVANLDHRIETLAGRTHEDGEFEHQDGEEVTVSVASLILATSRLTNTSPHRLIVRRYRHRCTALSYCTERFRRPIPQYSSRRTPATGVWTTAS